MTAGLNERLACALRTITVGADRRTATVGAREVSAAGPASLRRELTSAIYDELHAGRDPVQPLAGRYLRDEAVEGRLRELMPYTDTVRGAVLLDTWAGESLVLLDGVKVWLRDVRVGTSGVDVLVRVPAARPALSVGYFLADSATEWKPDGPVLRIYVHVTSMTAVFGAWAAVLATLAGLGTGYRVKVVSSAELLPRRDGLVVYVPGTAADVTGRIASAIEPVPGIGAEVSVFASPVAPGLATAWEPSDARPELRGLSFGEHRSAVLAGALVEHAGLAEAARYQAIAVAFLAAGIDPADPACPLQATASSQKVSVA
jgi:hypothetical protein